jgi:hypothetical protein
MPHSNFCGMSFCSAWRAPVFRCSQNVLHSLPNSFIPIRDHLLSVRCKWQWEEHFQWWGGVVFLDHKEKLDVTKHVCLHPASLTIYESRLLCTIHEVSSAAYTNITSKAMRKTEGPGLSELKTVSDKFPSSDTTPHEFSV